MAKLRWRGEKAKKTIQTEAARRLLSVAVRLQSLLKQKLSVRHPPASQRGEYPRLRTGWGRAHVLVAPLNVAAVAANLTVRVGYGRNAWYMARLETKLGRLGLLETVRRHRAELEKAAGIALTIKGSL